MKLKVCGMKYQDNITEVAALQPDYLGFIFAESPRQLSQVRAAEIINSLPEGVVTVGVFVDECLSVVKMFAEELNLNYWQLT